MKLGRYVMMGLVALSLLGCGDNDDDTSADNGHPLSSLQISTGDVTMPLGFEQQLQAQAMLDDGSVQDVTQHPDVVWSSSDSAVVTIDEQGLIKGISPGEALITTTTTAEGESFSASAKVEVTDAYVTGLQMALDNTNATATVNVAADVTIPVELNRAFVATALFSDGVTRDVTHVSSLSWHSSDSSNARVSNEAGKKGITTGVAQGVATIEAIWSVNNDVVSASSPLTVTDAVITGLVIEGLQAPTPVGLSMQLGALASLSDGSDPIDVSAHDAISWSSSDPSVASVNATGLVSTLAPGQAIISASGTINGASFSASEQIDVSAATITRLEALPNNGSISVGLESQFSAIAHLSDGTSIDVTDQAALQWYSRDTGIATVSSLKGSKGLVTGKTTGDTNITASATVNGASLQASAQVTVTDATVESLQVTPATASIPAGLTQQFIATATLSDGSTLDVTDMAALSWSSSDPAIATVTNTGTSGKGLATGVTAGSATITASGTVNGASFSAAAELTVTDATIASLAITPETASVSVGEKVQYQAMATFSDGSRQDVTEHAATVWHSNVPEVAVVSNAAGSRGEVSALAEGSAQISAEMGGLSSAAAQLSVTSVPVAPAAPILIEPLRKQIASLQLSPEAFAFWNRTGINSPEGQAALKELGALVYDQFRDEFDFITVVINNEKRPFRMPTGEYTHIRNDVAGIGLGMFDHSAAFGSDGKLQGIYFLYEKKYLSTSAYGPILHEMAHRWANWIVPSSYGGHWGAELGIVGQLNDVAANFAEIELYLMGLMDATEMTDPASINAYNLIPADQKVRTPSTATSQKEFRSLLLILSDRPLTASEIQNYNDGATLLARTDNPTQQGTNFHKMTGGRGTLLVSELDTLQKP